jgi:hypothetical protein
MAQVAFRLFTPEAARRGIARLLVAALVLPAPTAVAAPLPAPGLAPAPLAGSGGGGTPSCSSDLASGEFAKASVARTELWPPNHQLQDVGLRVNEGDACAGVASTHVVV